MKWEQGEESKNLEDRRSSGTRTVAVGGIGMLLVVAVGYFLGVDPQQLTQILGDAQTSQSESGQVESRPLTPAEERTRGYSAKILRFTEKVWEQKCGEVGQTYVPPQMVLFSDRVSTGCGVAPGAVGPFYFAGERTVY